MRIIVLGGAGDVGSRAVEELARTAGVELVTVADRNVALAEKAARPLRGGAARVEVAAVNAQDHEAVVAAMQDHDLAASAVGPFHEYEAPLVAAALDAGVDYASVCDEWDAMESVFARFHGRARAEGRTVLTGLGASPGVTNVGVRLLSKDLDAVRRVDINVFQPLDAGGGPAVIRHLLHILTGDMAVWRGGRRMTIPACSESRVVEFPEFGPIRLWNMGHGEPISLPRYLGVEEVNFFMGFGRGARLLVQPARLGMFRSGRSVDRTVRALAAIERLKGPAPSRGAVRLDLWGSVAGREEHRMLCGTGRMRDVTGLSLAVGAVMLARREGLTDEGGVYSPEGWFQPAPFMAAMQAKGVAAYTDLAMTQPV